MYTEPMTTTQADLDRMLAKVRALLAKAEDPAATEAESVAYNDKAAELIARYGIDAALLSASDPTSDVVGDKIITVEAPYAKDKSHLLGRVAARLRCRVVLRNDGTVHMFGMASDLARVEILYTSLLVQATYGVAVANVPAWEHKAAYRRTWFAGFTAAVSERLRQSEERATASAPTTASTGRSTDLVLADRTAIVNRALSTVYPRLRAGRSRSLSGSGAGAGRNAGMKADLGSSRISRRTAGALS